MRRPLLLRTVMPETFWLERILEGNADLCTHGMSRYGLQNIQTVAIGKAKKELGQYLTDNSR